MPQLSTAVEVGAPLLNEIISRLDEERRWVVLDLGPARGATIERLGQLRCRLDIADLPARLPELEKVEDPEQRVSLLGADFPPARGEPADLVLCWTLINYLDQQTLPLLAKSLANRCRPNASIHALVEYQATHMPVRPRPVTIAAGNQISYPQDMARQIQAPRYSPRELGRLMPGLGIERTMLLGNGMQEFLFRV